MFVVLNGARNVNVESFFVGNRIRLCSGMADRKAREKAEPGEQPGEAKDAVLATTATGDGTIASSTPTKSDGFEGKLQTLTPPVGADERRTPRLSSSREASAGSRPSSRSSFFRCCCDGRPLFEIARCVLCLLAASPVQIARTISGDAAKPRGSTKGTVHVCVCVCVCCVF